MTQVLTDILVQLTRIADALEKKPKAKKQPNKDDLFGVNEDRAFRGKKPLKPMPEPFPMTDKHREFAAKNGFPKADFMFDQFKAHHRAKGSQFALWDSAWQTWVLNQRKFNGGAPEQPRPTSNGDGRI